MISSWPSLMLQRVAGPRTRSSPSRRGRVAAIKREHEVVCSGALSVAIGITAAAVVTRAVPGALRRSSTSRSGGLAGVAIDVWAATASAWRAADRDLALRQTVRRGALLRDVGQLVCHGSEIASRPRAVRR